MQLTSWYLSMLGELTDIGRVVRHYSLGLCPRHLIRLFDSRPMHMELLCVGCILTSAPNPRASRAFTLTFLTKAWLPARHGDEQCDPLL
jgi:hypothetical protein